MLAHSLDGDVDGSWNCAEIREHLEQCATCSTGLARARRLDAALAAATAVPDAEEAQGLLEPLLEAAIERIERERAPAHAWGATRRFGGRLLSAAAAVVLLACGLRWFLARPRPHEPFGIGIRSERLETTPPARPEQAADRAQGLWVGPLLPPRDPAQRTRSASGEARVRSLADRVALGFAPAGTERHRASTDQEIELRRETAARLLDERQEGARKAWLEALDRVPAELARGMVEDARQRPAVLASLARTLRSRSPAAAEVKAAARIGGRALREALSFRVRREPSWVPEVASAIRSGIHGPDAALLLLDIWGGLVARGHAVDDEKTAERLFAGQPGSLVPGLLAELSDPNVPRRRRAILALGTIGDPSSLEGLHRMVGCPSRDLALTAGWALGRLPQKTLEALEPEASDPEAWILRAALTQARLPVSKRWLDELDLAEAERELVGRSRLSLSSFAVTAPLFQERRRPSR
ncbi:MAG: hypothetical protein Fur0037_20510 [Planctomycetota bacterium]